MANLDARQPETPGEEKPQRILRRPVLVATVVCAVTAAAGHLAIWIGYAAGLTVDDRPLIPWQPVTGIALSVVAIVSFGGFYLVSRLPRMAIAASFLLTFFVLFTFALTITELDLRHGSTAADLVDDLRKIVNLVTWWYFGSETAVSGLKVWASYRAGAGPAAIREADLSPVAGQNP